MNHCDSLEVFTEYSSERAVGIMAKKLFNTILYMVSITNVDECDEQIHTYIYIHCIYIHEDSNGDRIILFIIISNHQE